MTPRMMDEFSWYSEALSAHDNLDLLVSSESTSNLLPRLVEQIKQWEVGFLGHLGVDEETSKMQNRLGIKVVPDQTPSTESLTTSWKVIQEDPELPKWSARDAVKVCSYYCIYRLLDACAFAEGMPASAPTRPRRKLRVKITTKQSEWIRKVEDWPRLLFDFKSHIEGMEAAGVRQNTTGEDNACVRIVRAMSALEAGRKGSKVLHNFLAAAMHIAYIKQTTFGGALPDIPDSLDQSIDTSIASHLTQREKNFLNKLFPASATQDSPLPIKGVDKKVASSVRIPLQAALAITPLILLHTTMLTTGSYNRSHMLEFSLALGSEKPPLLLEIEKKIWQTLFILSEGRPFPFEPLKELRNNLPWGEIAAVRGTPIAAWFKLDHKPNLSAPSISVPPPIAAPPQAEGAAPHNTTPDEEEVDHALRKMLIDGEASVATGPSNENLNLGVAPSSSNSVEGSGEMDVDEEGELLQNRSKSGNGPVPKSAALESAAAGMNVDELTQEQQVEEPSLRSMGKRRDPLFLPGSDDEIAPSPEPDFQEDDPSFNKMELDEDEDGDEQNGEDEQDDEDEVDQPQEDVPSFDKMELDGNDDGEDEVDLPDEDSDSTDGEVAATQKSPKKTHATVDGSKTRKSDRLAKSTENEAKKGKGGDQRSGQNPGPSNARSVTNSPKKPSKKKGTSKPAPPGAGAKKNTKLGPKHRPSAGNTADDPILVDYLWEERSIDKYVKDEPALDTVAKPLKFRGETKIVAFTPDGEKREYDPLFHFQDMHTNLRTFLNAVGRNYLFECPLYISKPDASCLKIMTEEEFEFKSCREISKILRRQSIVITGCQTPRLKFDAAGLRTLKPLHALIAIQDLSVPSDAKMEDRIVDGTVQQLLDSANDPDGKILNALEFPFWQPKSSSSCKWESFATDLVAWDQTESEKPWKKFKTQTDYPFKDMRWGLAGTSGALTWQHIDSDGQNSVIENVGDGDKLAILRKCSRHESLSSIDFFLNNGFNLERAIETGEHEYEAVVLLPGTRLIMRANTPHLVLTPQSTICYGGHFYATTTMQDTASSLIHSFVASEFVTNTFHFATRLMLRRIAHFYYLGLIKGIFEPNSQEQEHLPDLETFEGVLDLFSLCNLVILGNVLDFRTYSAPNQGVDVKATPVQRERMQKYDHNAIPYEEREASVFARGVCVQILHWFDAHFEIQDSRTGKQIQENVAASHLARQAIALQTYKEAAVANEVNGAPHCTPSNLKRQIENALKVYDDAYKIWTRKKSSQVRSLAYQHEDSKHFKVVRKLPHLGYEDDEDFESLGYTEFDEKYFKACALRTLLTMQLEDQEEEAHVKIGKRRRL